MLRNLLRDRPLLVLLAIHALATLWPLMLRADRAPIPFVAIGVFLLFTQPVLLALWAGLAVAPLRIRLPLAVGLGLTSFFSWSWCVKTSDRLGHGEHYFVDTVLPAVMIFISLLGAFFLLFGVANLARRRGLRLVAPWQNMHEIVEDLHSNQFRLSDLLLWTAGIAVFLAAARVLFAGTELLKLEGVLNLLLPWLLGGPLAALLGLCPLVFCGAMLDRRYGQKWFSSTFLVGLAIATLLAVVPPVLLLVISPRELAEGLVASLIVWIAVCGLQFFLVLAMFIPLLLLLIGEWEIIRLHDLQPKALPEFEPPHDEPELFLQQLKDRLLEEPNDTPPAGPPAADNPAGPATDSH